MPTRRLLSALLALSTALVATPVMADCQMAGPVAEELPRARVAFVGEVTGVNGSEATFAVSEVWRGDVGPVAEVGGSFDDGSFGEDDRTWELGQAYLVLPYVDGNALRDTICSATTEWTDELAELRPADARILADEGGQPPGIPLLVFGIGLVIALFAAISWIAFRRSPA